jgi:spermidine synthase
LATFFDVFPNGTIWANDINNEGYDVVLLGWNGAAKIDVDQMQRRIELNASLRESLRQAAFGSASDLLATYAGRGRDLSSWLAGAHVNTDLDLRLQYLAGMGLNYNNAGTIKQQISMYQRYPEDLLVGSPELLRRIELRIQPR